MRLVRTYVHAISAALAAVLAWGFLPDWHPLGHTWLAAPVGMMIFVLTFLHIRTKPAKES